MDDMRMRLQQLDRIPAPDLWKEISARQPSNQLAGSTASGRKMRRILLASLVGVILVAGLLVTQSLVTDREPSIGLDIAGGPRPTNGMIAFVRTDQSTMLQEGATVESALYVIKPDGSGVHQVASGATFRSSPAWSPDGQMIAFAHRGIQIVRADGKEVTTLAPCEERCDGVGPPAWSPDGRRVAFWSDREGVEGLWVAAANDPHALTLLREDLSVLGAPAWSPDGRRIAVIDATPGNIAVLDSSDGEVVQEIAHDGIDFGEVTWSPDGTTLATAEGAWGGGIYLMASDGSNIRQLTSSPNGDHYPAWSPDGQHIVFTRAVLEPGSDGFVGDLFLIDLDSGQERRLTSGPRLDCCPSWQPVPPK